jgi:hypothetical protein
LKPGGKLIPSSVDLFVTSMECPEQVRVSKNDKVEVAVRSMHRKSVITSSVRMRGEAAHKQSTYNGMFLSEEDIQDLFLDLCPTCACVGMRDFLC